MSATKKQLIFRKSFFITCAGIFLCSGITGCGRQVNQNIQKPIEEIQRVEAVAALGKLSPQGEIRKLAAPVSGFGGTPRISKLFVEEGDKIQKGQLLAVFDNQPKINSDLAASRARLETLKMEISMKIKEISRYEKTSLEGATSKILLDQKKEDLIILRGKFAETEAQILGLKSDLYDSELKSPIDGTVLRIHTRVGERSGVDGVLEVGASQRMQALIEVYESDISRIRLGQKVSMISENGGFESILSGTVLRISPQVRQRNILSTDPTGDADARVIEVLVKLSDTSADSVSRLTGIKVIARFDPL